MNTNSLYAEASRSCGTGTTIRRLQDAKLVFRGKDPPSGFLGHLRIRRIEHQRMPSSIQVTFFMSDSSPALDTNSSQGRCLSHIGADVGTEGLLPREM
jgi:hypothetical protein